MVTQKRIHACPEPLPCFRIVTVRLPLLPFTKSPGKLRFRGCGLQKQENSAWPDQSKHVSEEFRYARNVEPMKSIGCGDGCSGWRDQHSNRTSTYRG